MMRVTVAELSMLPKPQSLARYTIDGRPMNQDDWIKLFRRQHGSCPMCHCRLEPTFWRRPVVEHNHATNTVRSITCQLDNLILARYHENAVEIAHAFAEYLMRTEYIFDAKRLDELLGVAA